MKSEQQPPLRGTVKGLRYDKGFGFIRSDSGVDFFFHSTFVEGDKAFDQLKDGDQVLFVPDSHPKGPRASRVTT